MVQHRKTHDRFARKVEKIIVKYLCSEEAKNSEDFDAFFEKLKKYIENEDLLKKTFQHALALHRRPDIVSKLFDE